MSVTAQSNLGALLEILSLDRILDNGNTTGGNSIIFDPGDQLRGTDGTAGGPLTFFAGSASDPGLNGGSILMVATPSLGTGAGGNISLNAGGSNTGLAGSVFLNPAIPTAGTSEGSVVIGGSAIMTFTGRGAQLPGVSPGQGRLWVRDSPSPSVLVYTDDNNNDFILSAGGGGESLSVTLAIGNDTNGTDIEVSAGDSVLFNQILSPSTTPGATQGTLWVRDDSPNVLVFTNNLGSDFVVSGGGGEDLGATLAIGNTTSGTDIVVTIGDEITGFDGGAGQDLSLRGGNSSTLGTDGANVIITSGNSTNALGAGSAGDVQITGATPNTATGQGGSLQLTAGAGGTGGGNAPGGSVSVTAGNSAGSAAGGDITLTSGNSGTGASGGAFTAQAGSGSVGGAATLRSGANTVAGNASGAVLIENGATTDPGDYGLIRIASQDALPAEDILGGSIEIEAGDTGLRASGPGGSVDISAGDTAGTGALATGGDIALTAGDGSNGRGGNITLSPGAGTSPGSIVLDYAQFPAADGGSGDVLTTNGAGALTWTPGGGGGGENLAATLALGAFTGGTTIITQSSAAVSPNTLAFQSGSYTGAGNFNGGGVSLRAGTTAGTGENGNIEILGGGATGAGPATDVIFLRASNIPNRNGGFIQLSAAASDVIIQGGAAVGAGGLDGGSLAFTGGVGNGAGAGGSLAFSSGVSGASGNSGDITLTVGAAGAAGGAISLTAGQGVDGGDVSLTAGLGTADPGNVILTAGDHTGGVGATAGGSIFATAGAGNGAGGGSVIVRAGADTAGAEGNVYIAGSSASVSTFPQEEIVLIASPTANRDSALLSLARTNGQATMRGGDATGGNDGGGGVVLAAGDGDGTGIGGGITIVAGNGGATARGGNVNIAGGPGGTTSGDGGDINLTPGFVFSGIPGTVNVAGSLIATGTLTGSGFLMDEQPVAPVATAGGTQGLLWVSDTNPNTLYFTDNAGTDFQLGTGGFQSLSAMLSSNPGTSNSTGSTPIITPDSIGATPPPLTFTAGSHTGGIGTASGADVLVSAGASDGDRGGDIFLQAGASTGTGTEGGIEILGPGATPSTAADGNIRIATSPSATRDGAEAVAFLGGGYQVDGGDATSGNTAGGFVSLNGGQAFGSATGGGVSLTGGDGSGISGSNGGAVALLGGSASGPGGGSGGDINITGGTGLLASGTGGGVAITGGNAGTTTATGGALTLTSGDGGTTSGDAGDITLSTGSATSGANGSVIFNSNELELQPAEVAEWVIIVAAPGSGDGVDMRLTGSPGAGSGDSGGNLILEPGASGGGIGTQGIVELRSDTLEPQPATGVEFSIALPTPIAAGDGNDMRFAASDANGSGNDGGDLTVQAGATGGGVGVAGNINLLAERVVVNDQQASVAGYEIYYGTASGNYRTETQAPASGDGVGIEMRASDAALSGGDGGEIVIQGGDLVSAGTPGGVELLGGGIAATGSLNGAIRAEASGVTGASARNGGQLLLSRPSTTLAIAGAAQLVGGQGTAGNVNGGSANVSGGDGQGSGNGGAASLAGGAGSTGGGNGGAALITSGDGTAGISDGGLIRIQAGDGFTTGNGGSILIEAGESPGDIRNSGTILMTTESERAPVGLRTTPGFVGSERETLTYGDGSVVIPQLGAWQNVVLLGALSTNGRSMKMEVHAIADDTTSDSAHSSFFEVQSFYRATGTVTAMGSHVPTANQIMRTGAYNADQVNWRIQVSGNNLFLQVQNLSSTTDVTANLSVWWTRQEGGFAS